MSSKLHVKKDDTVLIISGDERGNTGKVIEVSPKEGKVIVEGRNKVKKHVKPRKMGDPGGIIEAEGAMYVSKVQVICPRLQKADPRRPQKIYADGSKQRICKRCGETL